jgi:heat shock protein HslJ
MKTNIGTQFKAKLMVSMSIRYKKCHYAFFLALGILLIPLPGNSKLFPLTESAMTKPAIAAQQPNNLKGTIWQLVRWDNPAFVPESEIILRFTDKNLNGSTGCNRYQGGYQLKGSQLQVGAIAKTRMACADNLMQQEMAYLKALETIQSYTLTTDGKLEIRCGQTGPSQVLQFVRVETTAASLNPSNNPTSMTLEGTAWQLIRIGSASPLKQRPATLAFKNNSISGTAGCNRFAGSFTQKDDQLSISSELISTMMACPEPWMEQEQKVLSLLKVVTRYSIDEQGQLLLYSGDDGDKPALVLVPLDTNLETNKGSKVR